MITLYDLVFQDDRRPSPFCWRAKFAMAHKHLTWTEVPTGFTEKHKIAFADSKTVPVIQDDDTPVKDSWAIAVHLDDAYPEHLLLKNEMGYAYSQFINGWADTIVNVGIFPLIIGDLYDRIRPEDKEYFAESRGTRLGTRDFAGFQSKGREKGLATFRAALEPVRRSLRHQNFLSGAEPAYPDYILAGSFMWPRSVSSLELLETSDPVHAWRERMLDLFDGLGRKAKTA
jgi:glutathione S-transferase